MPLVLWMINGMVAYSHWVSSAMAPAYRRAAGSWAWQNLGDCLEPDRPAASGSAGALTDALNVEDDHGAGLQPQPAALNKLGQGLIDCLPRGAHQLGQLLLGQLMGDQHAIGRGP